MSRLRLATASAAVVTTGASQSSLACEPDYTGVTLTFARQTGPYIASALQIAGKKWAEKTCGTVNVVEFPWSELYPKIVTALTSGETTFDGVTFAPHWSQDFTPYLAEMPEEMRPGAAGEAIAPVFRDKNGRGAGGAGGGRE